MPTEGDTGIQQPLFWEKAPIAQSCGMVQFAELVLDIVKAYVYERSVLLQTHPPLCINL